MAIISVKPQPWLLCPKRGDTVSVSSSLNFSLLSLMKRYGMVIHLRPDCVDEYKRLHAAVWPGVLAKIHACNVRNYSIHYHVMDDGTPTLFSYFEYLGSDFEGDMALMAADAETQRWWAACKPLMKPLQNRKADEFWTCMDELFWTP